MQELVIRPSSELQKHAAEQAVDLFIDRLEARQNGERTPQEARQAFENLRPNTQHAQKIGWRQFRAWTKANAISVPATEADVKRFIDDRSPHWKRSTIHLRLEAIKYWHLRYWNTRPVTKAVREYVTIAKPEFEETSKRAPLMIEDVKAICDALTADGRLIALRNRAIVLMGFCGGFRRSELAGLKLADIEFTDKGLSITLRTHKTSRQSGSHTRALLYASDADYCPIRTLQAWLEAAEITQGHLFRSFRNKGHLLTDRPLDGNDIYELVRVLAKRIGKDAESFGAHSLRSGFATQAHDSGAKINDIMKHANWRSMQTVQGYFHVVDMFKQNPTREFGL